MRQKVLFINPNRFLYPPVIPIGIEYLVHSLRRNSIIVEVADLCFSANPSEEIEDRIKSFNPDAVCMTIRNIDSALYENNEYFLPQIRSYVEQIKSLADTPVIIGGAGLLVDAQGILNFVGADIAVVGPGEETLPSLLKDAHLLKGSRKVIKGKLSSSFCPSRTGVFDYSPYIKNDGIPGFETHKGCTSNCVYCIEAGTSVTFRKPDDVVSELKHLVDSGFNHFHLCDSEFNEELEYCIEFLKLLVKEKLGIKWALYMKPGNYNRQLFNLLKESGAYIITLSVDTYNKCPDYWHDVESIVFLAKKAGIRISIDFLTGFPYEKEDTLKEALDLFRRVEPDEVVINIFTRIYGNTKIRKIIDKDASLKRFLIGNHEGNDSFLAPCFYNHIPINRLKELTAGEGMFRIAGQEKVVNYQKAL